MERMGRNRQSECSISQNWQIEARTVEAHKLRRRHVGKAIDKTLDQLPFRTGPDMNDPRANHTPRAPIGLLDIDCADASNPMKWDFHKCVVRIFTGTSVSLAEHPANLVILNFKSYPEKFASRRQIRNS